MDRQPLIADREAIRVVCFGGATLDRKCRAAAPIRAGTSNLVTGRSSYGGLARNICENLARLGICTSLVSAVGDDESGRLLLRYLQNLGAETSRVAVVAGHSTAEYAAILNLDNSLAFGIADMEVFSAITVDDLQRVWPHLADSSSVFVDCNLPAPVLQALLTRKRSARLKLAADTVSVRKANRLPADLTGIDVLFATMEEAEALLGRNARHALPPGSAAQALHGRSAGQVVMTLGVDGVVVASDLDGVAAVPAVSAHPADVTGAGDALIAGTLSSLIAGSTLVEAVRVGSLAAALTVENEAAVHPELSGSLLASMAHRLGRGFAVAAGRTGATTVAATMICAHLAGIEVFATGGIGGVHRSVENTMDISADLEELARTSVTVVCAGAKALLDLPRPLEYLETRGVPVVCYRTDRFPAFWSQASDLPAPIRLDTPGAIAALVRTKRRLCLDGGVVVANPVPEADEIGAAEMAGHIEAATAAARDGVTGKAVTPFLLARFLDLTGGRSLATNITLAKSNAALAAQLAGELVRSSLDSDEPAVPG